MEFWCAVVSQQLCDYASTIIDKKHKNIMHAWFVETKYHKTKITALHSQYILLVHASTIYLWWELLANAIIYWIFPRMKNRFRQSLNPCMSRNCILCSIEMTGDSHHENQQKTQIITRIKPPAIIHLHIYLYIYIYIIFIWIFHFCTHRTQIFAVRPTRVFIRQTRYEKCLFLLLFCSVAFHTQPFSVNAGFY